MTTNRAWRHLPRDLLRFATTELHELHVAVMCVFEDAAVLQPALTFDKVRAGLAAAGWDEPLDDGQLQHTLDALKEWRLLDVTQDHSARYATPEDFERRNLQWSLTPHGQAAIGGVLHAVHALAQSVSLQPAVIDAIADGLGELCDLIATTPVDAPRVATRLAEVESHLASLVTNVRQFNTQLQRLLRDDATTDAVFEDVKQRTVTYLQEYIHGVDRPSRRVASGIARLADLGASVLFDQALVGANLAPVPGDDPSVAWLAERAKRWDALLAWFAPADAAEARIRSLVGIAKHAILQLLRVLERRWESRRRSASIADDFRTLARWFADAADEDEAHRLFVVAFGIWPARHAHLSAPDTEDIPTTASWLASPPVVVAPTLRTSGSVQNRGRVHPIRDTTMLRARRQREQAETITRHEHVRASLATDGGMRLSAFEKLDAHAFAELLVLLSDALSAPAATDGSRRSLSADGRVEIVVRDATDGSSTRLRTDHGMLTAPDLVVEITLTDVADPFEEAAGG